MSGEARTGRIDATPAPARAGAGRASRVLLAALVWAAGVVVVAAASPEAAYRDGPPPGFSGGFGEQSCHACHFQEDPDDGVGDLVVSAPEQWAPGGTYRVTVTLTRPGMVIGGFQLTARHEDGGQAGSLSGAPEEDGRVTVATDRDVQYAYHTRAGTGLTSAGTARWELVWTAPERGGTVLFHAAGNAADEDDTVSGDFVYTAVLETTGSGR